MFFKKKVTKICLILYPRLYTLEKFISKKSNGVRHLLELFTLKVKILKTLQKTKK